MNETYEYSIIDNLGWFSETGTIEISPGIYAIIPMSGVIFDSGIIDTLMFTVIPQHAPLRYKVDTLFVNSQLFNAVGNVFPQKFELCPAFSMVDRLIDLGKNCTSVQNIFISNNLINLLIIWPANGLPLSREKTDQNK